MTDIKKLKWIMINKKTYLGEISKDSKGVTIIIGVPRQKNSEKSIAYFLKQQNLDELEIITLSGQHSCSEKNLTLKDIRIWNELYAQMKYIKDHAVSLLENKLFETDSRFFDDYEDEYEDDD